MAEGKCRGGVKRDISNTHIGLKGGGGLRRMEGGEQDRSDGRDWQAICDCAGTTAQEAVARGDTEHGIPLKRGAGKKGGVSGAIGLPALEGPANIWKQETRDWKLEGMVREPDPRIRRGRPVNGFGTCRPPG